MAHYIVAYTINSDSQKGTDFSNFLETIGLKEKVDQSTRYGNFEGNYQTLQFKLRTECEKLKFTKEDVVYLFSAGKDNNLTIKKSSIL